jgi:hypothetical protein
MLSLGVQSEHHEWAEAWASRAGVQAESPLYLNAVALWRDLWRPPQVKILLVAESHVAEHPGDEAVRVNVSLLPANMPDRFVRLVYCLGYGEGWQCNPKPQKNGGTWQFWDLFGALAGGPEDQMPRARRQADRSLRLAWKIDTLNALSSRGIWLVDAAIVGFYAPGGGRPFTGRAYRQMLRESFTRFVWPSVAHEPLEQVWTIGRGVGDALAGLEGIDSSRTISQPQDRDGQRYAAGLRRLAGEVRLGL